MNELVEKWAREKGWEGKFDWDNDLWIAPKLKFRFEDRAGLQCSRCFAGIWLSGF